MAIPQIRRSDFTSSLVHMTRERKEYSSADFVTQKLDRIVPAFDVLKEILASATIRGSGNEGYVKGKRPAVCLSEIPLSAMHQFAQPPSEETARYRFYGIALMTIPNSKLKFLILHIVTLCFPRSVLREFLIFYAALFLIPKFTLWRMKWITLIPC